MNPIVSANQPYVRKDEQANSRSHGRVAGVSQANAYGNWYYWWYYAAPTSNRHAPESFSET
jgi:hypothetical protein